MKKTFEQISRRQFLRKAGTAAGGLWLASYLPPFLSGCGGGEDAAGSLVGVARMDTVAGSVRRAVELAGGLDFIRPGETVLLKPNLVSAHASPATNSPELVSAVIACVRERDPARVIFADRSQYTDVTAQILDATGLGDAARDAGAEVIPFDDGEWVKVNPAGAANWAEGFSIPALLGEADHIISLPIVKTHRYSGFTMALKNWVGIISPGDRQTVLHMPAIDPLFGTRIAEIHLAVRADLYIMDATRVFVSGGPHEGEVREPGMVIASRDPVATDVFGLSLLKYLGTEARIQDVSVWEQVQILRAVELGLGAGDASQIKILSDGIAEIDSIREILNKMKIDD